jgi:hypothetical protein
MTFKCHVNADLFRRVAMCISSEETRYYLHGVFIEKHPQSGALLVAGDGFKMLVGHDPTAEVEGSAIVKLPKDMLKIASENAIVKVEDGQASVVTQERIMSSDGCLIDGTFPDWRKAIPKKVGGVQLGAFDQNHLTVLAEAMSINFGNKRAGKPLRLAGCDALEPHLALGDVPYMFGIAMPLRNADNITFPAWSGFKDASKRVKKAA